MKIHSSITIPRVTELVMEGMYSLYNPGICLSCGGDSDGCEPDARNYECTACGEFEVYGAEEILLML